MSRYTRADPRPGDREQAGNWPRRHVNELTIWSIGRKNGQTVRKIDQHNRNLCEDIARSYQ
jgi:hypothetical protein